MKYLLMIIPLLISGCFIPRTFYSPIDTKSYKTYIDNSMEVLRDSTFRVLIQLPVFTADKDPKLISFGIDMGPYKNTQYQIHDLHIEALNDNGHIIPTVGNMAVRTQIGVYHPQRFTDLTDDQIYKSGSGDWIFSRTRIDYKLIKKCKYISIHYYLDVIINGKQIVLEDTIKVRKNVHWQLVLGD